MAAEGAEVKTPSRAPSAYWIWLSENREEVVKVLGGVKKGSEVAKKAGEMWKALSDEERAPFVKRAEEGKAAFEANKPPKEEKAKPVKHEDPNYRKKPMTPVFAFVNEKREEIMAMGIKGLGEISKKATEMYNALPEAERKERQKKFEDERAAYKAWQESEEGAAAMAGKKAAMAEERAEKKAKQDKKDAKIARKEAREAKAAGGAAAEEKADDAAEKQATPAKTTGRGRKSAEAPPAKAPAAKRSRGAAAAPAGPVMDESVVKEAESLGYGSSLKNLAGRQEVVESGKSAQDILAALKASNGLVNPAKRALLGA